MYCVSQNEVYTGKGLELFALIVSDEKSLPQWTNIFYNFCIEIRMILQKSEIILIYYSLLYVTAQLRLISVCFKSLFLSFRSQALGVTVIDNDSGSDNDTKLGVFFQHIYNPGQDIWDRIKETSKTREEKKSLMSPFACFLTAIAKI